MRIHTNEKPYICEICKKTFSQSSGLTVHMRTHTNKKPYICEICEKPFASGGNLTVHMRTHTNEKPYICEICEKQFVHSGHLKNHLRTHSQEKSYKCNSCDMTFTTSGGLSSHIRIHTTHRRHKCATCGKLFRHSSALNVHMRTHTLERPYQCKVCGKSFRQSGGFQYHMRIHTAEKPYQCISCGSSFAAKHSLKNHLIRHEESKTWTIICPCADSSTHLAGPDDVACQQRFPTQASLDIHIQKCHTVEGLQQKFQSEERMATFFTEQDILFNRDWENVISYSHCPQLQLTGARSRPDFFLTDLSVKLGIAVLIGNDEFAHRRYPTNCEFSRMLKIAGCLFQNPQMPVRMVYIRFNPHFYTKDGVIFDPSLETRYARLLELLENLPDREGLLVIYLYYDTQDGKLCIFEEQTGDAARAIQECSIRFE